MAAEFFQPVERLRVDHICPGQAAEASGRGPIAHVGQVSALVLGGRDDVDRPRPDDSHVRRCGEQPDSEYRVAKESPRSVADGIAALVAR